MRLWMDLPLDTKLDEESAGRELVKCVWNNPERNEHCDNKDENAGKGK